MEVLVVPGDGTEVVRKTATLPGERERLLREAEVLRRAMERDVPGLATVVAWPGAEDEPCLVTAAVAGPSLAVAAPLPATEVAGVAAEVARILAELHHAGLVHGAVEPGHVVLDGGGGLILVGLGSGGPVGAPGEDPAAGPLDPADDVAGWGMLVGHLLDWSAAGEEEPLDALRRTLATRRARRGGRRPPGGRPDEDERRVLAALADQAQEPDPARRPSARSLAVAVPHRIPAARVPGSAPVMLPRRRPASGLLDRLSAHAGVPPPLAAANPAGDGPADPPHDPPVPPAPSPARHRVPGRMARRVGAGRLGPDGGRASVGSSGVADEPAPDEALAADHAHGPGSRPPRRSTRRVAAAAAATALVLLGGPAVVARLRTAELARHAPAPSPRCAPAAPPAADVDGDGCEEPVRWADGVLQAGGARFALAGAGTAWTVGDWDCDGRRTLALLHDAGLAVFDTWPAPGAELQARQVSAPRGATDVAAVAGPDGCDRPALRRPGAADLVVDLGQGP